MSGGAPKVYHCPRRMLAVRLHPAMIESLRELAYRQRATINEVIERWAARELTDAGLPAPDPRQDPSLTA